MNASDYHQAAFDAVRRRGVEWKSYDVDYADVVGCDPAWMLAHVRAHSGPDVKLGRLAARMARGILPRGVYPHVPGQAEVRHAGRILCDIIADTIG